MNKLSEEITQLKSAIQTSQEQLIIDLLSVMNLYEIEENLFQNMLHQVNDYTRKTFRLVKALEGQEVIEKVLTNRLK